MNNEEFYKTMEELHVDNKLRNIKKNYLAIRDEYYKTSSRDSAFLKDLMDVLCGIEAVFEVYVRDKYIHHNYALEKLHTSKHILDSTINYFELKRKEKEE